MSGLATSFVLLNAQASQKLFISGQLADQQNMQPVAYATVALRKTSDSTFITGTASNADGEFSLENIAGGNYCLIVKAIGYNSISRKINLTENYKTGPILLQAKSVTLGEVVVQGERVKAKVEPDKTTYFINKKIYDASDNGVDLLNYIPGVQVDIMKNISIEGNQRIIILVDGKERDRSFLNQLNAAKIDKVEIITSPGSKYDADISGVINIILKKDKAYAIDGHIHAELPTSGSEIYIFPDYSLNYNLRKINLYTSYDGDLSYFNITENSYRSFHDSGGISEITATQDVRQKYWAHRFHFGADYDINEKNQLSFYTFYNPYSSEHSGSIAMQVNGDALGSRNWSALKNDDDVNHSSYYTLNYKHLFNKPSREIAFDLSYFNFKAFNSTTLVTVDSITGNYPAKQINAVKPGQNSLSLKIDYSSTVTEKLRFDIGIKLKTQELQDRQTNQFKYDENILSLYGAATYSFSKYTVNVGLRAERSTSGMTNSYHNNIFALLPNATINYKINSKQNLKLSYSRTLTRPNIYELNPYTSSDDPYSIQSGNPSLKPEFQQYLSLVYSKNFESDFISLKMYYLDRSDAINHYTFINDAAIFESRVANLGRIHGYGIQMAGTIKVHKTLTLNPFLKVTGIFTHSNDLARQYDIYCRHKIAFESGLSAIATFKYDIIASLRFQYASPLIQIQTISFSDALYIISLEKTFKGKFKAGISSALPFAGIFTYHGTEIRGTNFYSYSNGNIRLSAVPLWLKFSYTFNSGKTLKKPASNTEDIENMPRKGF